MLLLRLWSNREENICFQLIKPNFSWFGFLFFCCCCGKNNPSPWSTSGDCRQVSCHLVISLGAFLCAPYLTSPLLWFWCRCHVLIVLYPSGRLSSPDIWSASGEDRNTSPSKEEWWQKAASGPCTQEGSGTLRQPLDQLLSFPLNSMFICHFRWNHSRALQEPARFCYSAIKGRHQSSPQSQHGISGEKSRFVFPFYSLKVVTTQHNIYITVRIPIQMILGIKSASRYLEMPRLIFCAGL